MHNVLIVPRYQIMLNCWQTEPEARPSFSALTKQLKDMENQHKVIFGLREFFSFQLFMHYHHFLRLDCPKLPTGIKQYVLSIVFFVSEG